jgi:polysaccharide biosynthesis protein PslH
VPLTVTPNRIVASSSIVASPPPLAAKRLLFVGAMFWYPNEDAVLWLAQTIAPRLRRLVPDIRISVAGAASQALVARMRDAGLEYLGTPVDLAGAYAATSIVVAPLRGGGGTKLKVLEAWLHHRPIVATRHACRGLGAVSGLHLLQADTAAQIANSCQRLFEEPDLAASLATEGHALLRSQFLLPCPDVVLAHSSGPNLTVRSA